MLPIKALDVTSTCWRQGCTLGWLELPLREKMSHNLLWNKRPLRWTKGGKADQTLLAKPMGMNLSWGSSGCPQCSTRRSFLLIWDERMVSRRVYLQSMTLWRKHGESKENLTFKQKANILITWSVINEAGGFTTLCNEKNIRNVLIKCLIVKLLNHKTLANPVLHISVTNIQQRFQIDISQPLFPYSPAMSRLNVFLKSFVFPSCPSPINITLQLTSRTCITISLPNFNDDIFNIVNRKYCTRKALHHSSKSELWKPEMSIDSFPNYLLRKMIRWRQLQPGFCLVIYRIIWSGSCSFFPGI